MSAPGPGRGHWAPESSPPGIARRWRLAKRESGPSNLYSYSTYLTSVLIGNIFFGVVGGPK